MPTIADNPIPAIEVLRRPIRDYRPQDSGGESFRTFMLGLANLLEELWTDDGDETLEADVVCSVLYAFPGLVIPGPPPGELVEMALDGNLIDAETAEALDTLSAIRRALRAFEPPGVAAALFHAALLAIFGMIEVFVLLDDPRGAEHCSELLTTAEAMADKFAGRS